MVLPCSTHPQVAMIHLSIFFTIVVPVPIEGPDSRIFDDIEDRFGQDGVHAAYGS
jgi:hypothetical protein